MKCFHLFLDGSWSQDVPTVAPNHWVPGRKKWRRHWDHAMPGVYPWPHGVWSNDVKGLTSMVSWWPDFWGISQKMRNVSNLSLHQEDWFIFSPKHPSTRVFFVNVQVRKSQHFHPQKKLPFHRNWPLANQLFPWKSSWPNYSFSPPEPTNLLV